MESKLSNTEYDAIKTVATDWAESEWFQIWMQLSRRDDKPKTRAQVILPKKEMAVG